MVPFLVGLLGGGAIGDRVRKSLVWMLSSEPSSDQGA